MKRVADGIILSVGVAASLAHAQFGVPWDRVPQLTIIRLYPPDWKPKSR